MTYLDWGCDPLREECESCLDALCNVCNEEFKKRSGNQDIADNPEGDFPDCGEPDCDRCDLEKKPDCSHCEIIFAICRDCGEHKTCECRIC
jgi:hypothetical protein